MSLCHDLQQRLFPVPDPLVIEGVIMHITSFSSAGFSQGIQCVSSFAISVVPDLGLYWHHECLA